MQETWRPSSYILTRYEIMRAMGAQVPADRPDFDPNQVEGTPEARITTRVDIRDFLLHKMHALRCHRTQMAPDGIFQKMSPEVIQAWRSKEHYALAAGTPVPSDEEARGDLFAGLR